MQCHFLDVALFLRFPFSRSFCQGGKKVRTLIISFLCVAELQKGENKREEPYLGIFLVLFFFFNLVYPKMPRSQVGLDVRVLITQQRYDELIEHSKKLSIYDQKYAKELQEVVKPPSAKKTKGPEEKEEEQISKDLNKSETVQDLSEQTGAGLSQSDLINQVSNKVIAEVLKLYSKEQSDQTGLGANDLLLQKPPSPVPDISASIEDNQDSQLHSVTKEPPASKFVIQKSNFSSAIEDQTLINLLPIRFQNRGETLIRALDNFKDTISWDKNGVVFIDHTSLTQSNIYEIFPKLFKFTKNYEKVFGLPEVITTIATLGFGYLINKHYLKGLSRHQRILNHDSIYKEIKSKKNWWYLGP